ncbi:MAG TPA: GH1 family beta-glucosidase [Streptosporangiaceae bacterium]|nr:GH1 family beta-glucosidase [Streptosporangiaceae bacterium]
MTDSPIPRFPAGFQWGVATSAYQIEGAVSEDGRGVSIWDTFCRRPGVIRDGHTGDVATDHYHRWEQDVALMADLGVTAYRFSIAWPRVQPDGAGPANPAGLDFYERLTDGLLARGITPVPTLYHWDLPQPLEDQGGWLARQTAERFADYAALAAGRLADRIGLWITLNEPYIVTAFGYALGIHAPGKALMLDALPTAHYQLLGHGLATAALRAAGARQVMITNNFSPAWPASDSEADVAATRAYDILQNRMFTDPVLLGSYPDLTAFGLGSDGTGSTVPGSSGLDCVRDGDLAIISAPIDGIGVNYYMPTRLSALPESPLPFQMQPIPGYPLTAFGWPVIPAGLTEILRTLAHRYGAALPPLYITENGCSQGDAVAPDGTVDDPGRIDYLAGHIRAVYDAIAAGVDVRGYFQWTLADNFEWSEGYHQRFGLIYVDHETQARTAKASFRWYKDMIAGQRAAG